MGTAVAALIGGPVHRERHIIIIIIIIIMIIVIMIVSISSIIIIIIVIINMFSSSSSQNECPARRTFAILFLLRVIMYMVPWFVLDHGQGPVSD